MTPPQKGIIPGLLRTLKNNTYLRCFSPGMNTVKLTMKVPNARAPGHQDSFCTINLNIGPGECEWFGVPFEYWGALKSLCDKHEVNYLHSKWWPNMQDLMDSEIPVYRFLQRPGDLVWVNSGCVHWTQAQGWCNNITWDVAPLTYKQYSLAMERYEWNKLQNCRSVVGMIHLTWNLARNVRVADVKLYESIKKTLLQSLKQVVLTQEYVKSLEHELRYHGRARSDPANFCGHCDKEVFGVLFIKAAQAENHVVQCLNCAHRFNSSLKGFICLEEYKIKELVEVFDAFKMHHQQTGTSGGPASGPVSGSVNNSTTLPASASSTAAQMAAAMAAHQSAAASVMAASSSGSNAASMNVDLIAAMGQYQQRFAAQQRMDLT
jgi:histone demethylase